MNEGQIKKLPRDADGAFKREFPANGKTYVIRSGDEGVSIRRYNEYEKLSLSLGYAATFQEMYNNLAKAQELANGVINGKTTFTDLVLHLDAMKNGIVDVGRRRFNMAFYWCSLFVVTAEEDLTTWSAAVAEQKIEDWNEEGYDAQDFLSLALNGVSGFKAVYRNLIQRMEKMEATV